MKYLLFILTVVLLLTLVSVFGAREAATGQGIQLVLAYNFGIAVAAFLLGSLGLLYKPNRFLGYVVSVLAVFGLMILGAAG